MQASKTESQYFGKRAILGTMHKKAEALALPLKAGLGMDLQTCEFDTDQFGTFTGEKDRQGSAVETAGKKARLAMRKTKEARGLGSEGSFGPHPLIPYMAFSQEFLVLVDDELEFQVAENVVSTNTNYCHTEVNSIDETDEFLQRARFPSHALIVKPVKSQSSVFGNLKRIFSGQGVPSQIYKGIRDKDSLASAIRSCRLQSSSGLVHVETDMRAHMNPTRMRVLRSLGIKLARRLLCLCQECGCPGFGISGHDGALPCEECRFPSDAYAQELHSCPRCQYTKTLPRRDGLTYVEALFCQRCNP
ncbi:MAG: hypothetical protein DKT66_02355 [Candidatus Melainabacteria bacterium]|nr:MAG: hypothetical protein DKT66_02355 [Candidatus Melainabacteria bacterium]